MDTKLTLKLDGDAIEQARRRGVSLSRMVETYFLGLAAQDEKPASAPSGVVAELAGILTGRAVDLSEKGRADYLARTFS